VAGDLETGDALIERGLELNPNLAWALLFGGWVKAWLGDAESAISRITRAMNFSPHDPSISNMRRAIAFAYFIAGRYQEALSASDVGAASPQNEIFALATAAASASHLGRKEEAQRAIARLIAADPTLRCVDLRERFPIKREEDFARWAEALRQAGLPE
jgi:tetratricopeptide (TPR) repeat protein